MLDDTDEVNDPQVLEMHSSGLELWRLLKYNFDSASAFNTHPREYPQHAGSKKHARCNVDSQRPGKTTSGIVLKGQRSQSS